MTQLVQHRGAVSPSKQRWKRGAHAAPPPSPSLHSSQKIFPDAASHSSPAPSFFRFKFKESHCPIPSWARKPLNPLYAVAAACVFLKEAFHPSDWRSRPSSSPPPLPLHSTAPLLLLLLLLLPSLLSPLRGSQCVAMETATWVCCSCLSFRCKRCTTSPDHKLVDGGLVIDGHSEVFGGEEDHLQFVQVLNSLCLASL